MLIYGTGGHAKVVFDCLKSASEETAAFFDDSIKETSFFGRKVLHYREDFLPRVPLIIAIGDNADRKKIALSVKHKFGIAAHSSVLKSDYSEIGEGAMLIHNAVIQSHAAIGKHVIVNTKASVDHDCQVGDFVHLGPGSTLCEGVKIGEGGFIGAGAVLLPGVAIGPWAIVGAGSIVTKDVGERCIVAGNPAKTIKNPNIE